MRRYRLINIEAITNNREMIDIIKESAEIEESISISNGLDIGGIKTSYISFNLYYKNNEWIDRGLVGDRVDIKYDVLNSNRGTVYGEYIIERVKRRGEIIEIGAIGSIELLDAPLDDLADNLKGQPLNILRQAIDKIGLNLRIEGSAPGFLEEDVEIPAGTISGKNLLSSIAAIIGGFAVQENKDIVIYNIGEALKKCKADEYYDRDDVLIWAEIDDAVELGGISYNGEPDIGSGDIITIPKNVLIELSENRDEVIEYIYNNLKGFVFYLGKGEFYFEEDIVAGSFIGVDGRDVFIPETEGLLGGKVRIEGDSSFLNDNREIIPDLEKLPDPEPEPEPEPEYGDGKLAMFRTQVVDGELQKFKLGYEFIRGKGNIHQSELLKDRKIYIRLDNLYNVELSSADFDYAEDIEYIRDMPFKFKGGRRSGIIRDMIGEGHDLDEKILTLNYVYNTLDKDSTLMQQVAEKGNFNLLLDDPSEVVDLDNIDWLDSPFVEFFMRPTRELATMSPLIYKDGYYWQEILNLRDEELLFFTNMEVGFFYKDDDNNDIVCSSNINMKFVDVNYDGLENGKHYNKIYAIGGDEDYTFKINADKTISLIQRPWDDPGDVDEIKPNKDYEERDIIEYEDRGRVSRYIIYRHHGDAMLDQVNDLMDNNPGDAVVRKVLNSKIQDVEYEVIGSNGMLWPLIHPLEYTMQYLKENPLEIIKTPLIEDGGFLKPTMIKVGGDIRNLEKYRMNIYKKGGRSLLYTVDVWAPNYKYHNGFWGDVQFEMEEIKKMDGKTEGMEVLGDRINFVQNSEGRVMNHYWGGQITPLRAVFTPGVYKTPRVYNKPPVVAILGEYPSIKLKQNTVGVDLKLKSREPIFKIKINGDDVFYNKEEMVEDDLFYTKISIFENLKKGDSIDIIAGSMVDVIEIAYGIWYNE